MAQNLVPKIKPCPPGGTGVHKWIYHACCVLAEDGFGPDDIEAYVKANATRDLQPGEVQNALRSIAGGPTERRPMWSQVSESGQEAARRKEGGLTALAESSPLECEDADDAVESLFFGNPLLCCGLSTKEFATKPRLHWQNLHQLQFIVPNPMTDKWGETQAGTKSQRTLQNTGPRHYLVVEFDEGTFDDHAAYLQRLNKLHKNIVLRCAVLSGGKSLHGWFDVRDRSEDIVKQFFHSACQLGADPATWTRSQFVRMPHGRRANGNLQDVVYFNPSNAPF